MTTPAHSEPAGNGVANTTGVEAADPSQFKLLKLLGRGVQGKVFLVKKIGGPDAGKLYAMKVLKPTCQTAQSKMEAERTILSKARHPFLVELHYAFHTEPAGKLYLVLDFLRGGDMYTHLSKKLMTEEEAAFYIAELALAIDYLHSIGVAYRDLKLENIMLDVEGHVCLVDFGNCKSMPRGAGARTYSFCGSLDNMAPEVVSREGHGMAVDWWSLGVLMYEFIVGQSPFQGSDRDETMRKISMVELKMPETLSENARSLLRAFFQWCPQERLGGGPGGLEELKRHPFFASIDWDKLYHRQVEPPVKPALHMENDSFYFDHEFTDCPPQDSP